MPVSTSVYSDVLESLYAATLDEARWQEFLAKLCAVTDSIIAFLVRNDDGIGRRFLASGGSAPPEGDEGYNTSDPVREAFMRKPRTGVLEVEDFLPHEQLIRSDYYPVMAKFRVTYGTCIVPRLTTRRYELITLWRGGNRPRLEPDLTEFLNMLFPHIQTALKIHQALAISRERTQNAEAILDASPTASLLLGMSGQLFYMNLAAQDMVRAGEGLTERNGRIAAVLPHHKAQLAALVRAAASERDFAGGAMVLERDGGKRPLQLLVSSFRAGGTGERLRALLLINDPSRPLQRTDSIFKELYGFTVAETGVANGLVSGFSPEAIADIRQVSVETVRSQIKALLAKTDTQRQTDLVRLLCAVPTMPPSWFE